MSIPKSKLLELDIVRGGAIAAVLLIHGTASATVDLPPGSRANTGYVMLNQLSYFPVQAFILISGLVLFYRYFDQWSLKQASGYYRKRLQYIGIPYLIWLFGYYLFYQWLDPNTAVHISAAEFIRLIPWAEIGYHLYFMVIIIQFYLIFPIVLTVARRWKLFGRYLWLFGIVLQAGYTVYVTVNQIAVPHQDRLFITYLALFCIGGSIGMNYERIVEWLNRNIWWITSAATAIGFTAVVIRLMRLFGMTTGPYTQTVLFQLYPVLVCLSLIWIGRLLLERYPRAAAPLSSLGAASFGIYLVHPLLQGLWSQYMFGPAERLSYHIATWGGIVLIFVVPWIFTAMLRRAKWSWVLFGK